MWTGSELVINIDGAASWRCSEAARSAAVIAEHTVEERCELWTKWICW